MLHYVVGTVVGILSCLVTENVVKISSEKK